MKIYQLFEALSDSDKSALAMNGYTVMDSEVIGNYTVYLMAMPDFVTSLGMPSRYQIAIQRFDESITDLDNQDRKLPLEQGVFKYSELKEVFQIVETWCKEHGQIMVGSHNQRKTVIYKKMVKRYTDLDIIDYDVYFVLK